MSRTGRGLVGKLLKIGINIPSAGAHLVEVAIAPDPRGETWTRRFGSSHFSSRLVSTPSLGVFEERFGLLRFSFQMDLSEVGGVIWRATGWSLASLPLPRSLAPAIRASAWSERDRYRFSVVVAHRWFGLLFGYRGYLTP